MEPDECVVLCRTTLSARVKATFIHIVRVRCSFLLLLTSTPTIIISELWRRRMAKQFQDEGRGPLWVTPNGTLLLREAQLYGPNYPSPPLPPHNATVCTGQKLSAGQELVLEPPQHKKPIAFCQDFSLQPAIDIVAPGSSDSGAISGPIVLDRGESVGDGKTPLSLVSSSSATADDVTAGALPLSWTSRGEQHLRNVDVVRLTQGQLHLVVSWGLCMGLPGITGRTMKSSLRGADGASVALVDCASDAAVTWSLAVNNTAPSHATPQAVRRVGGGSGGCLTAPDAVGAAVSIAPCVDGSAAQLWVFGTGGRLCVPMGCVSVKPQHSGSLVKLR